MMPRKNVDESRLTKIMDHLASRSSFRPRTGLILGTGLGKLAADIEVEAEIPYTDIPSFPRSTVPGHAGKLILGYLGGMPVIGFAGRFHYYEGYDMQEMTLPVRIMQAYGVSRVLISNAAGGLNPAYQGGDLVIIHDHINFFPDNPLRGINSDSHGDRFPDMLHAYDKLLIKHAEQVAARMGIGVHRGTYLGLQGPNLETPAEYRFFHQIGADLVGMSTIPEVIAAKHAGIPVLAFSIVSNMCYPTEQLTETHLDDVLRVVGAASEKLGSLAVGILEELAQK